MIGSLSSEINLLEPVLSHAVRNFILKTILSSSGNDESIIKENERQVDEFSLYFHSKKTELIFS